jgi:hypothetical protein
MPGDEPTSVPIQEEDLEHLASLSRADSGLLPIVASIEGPKDPDIFAVGACDPAHVRCEENHTVYEAEVRNLSFRPMAPAVISAEKHRDLGSVSALVVEEADLL